ncbi:MAG: 1,4-dihydroxy-6-naphthoate synthase [Bacteroidetes bacterium]|nr:1,4-dihydroxy-6-naphthoate synthase [Bacteroidota bacterium]
MKLTLGFSPCPNDTFIFDALVNKKIDTQGLEFDVQLEDVETLNQWAAEGKLALTKLSFNSLLQVLNQYALLHCGSALGKGVGPLLVCRKEAIRPSLKDARIAIPGRNTTANLLLSLAHPEATNKTELLFSEIEAAVLRDEFDAGLVIHESRFTYAERGLEKIMDLGDWWEQVSGAAIPLGGIAIRRDIPREAAILVDSLIQQSVRYAWQHYPTLPEFVTLNAQEMNESVMRQHIELYVNEYTDDLGPVGEKAIRVLFEKAREAGLIASSALGQIFY